MTEFEAASLALQEVANDRTLGVGLGQIAVIVIGLIVMRAEGRARAKEHADRHVESMTEVKAQHAESMAEIKAQHAESMAEIKAQHAESMEALKVLIERTGTNRESDSSEDV